MVPVVPEPGGAAAAPPAVVRDDGSSRREALLAQVQQAVVDVLGPLPGSGQQVGPAGFGVQGSGLGDVQVDMDRWVPPAGLRVRGL